MPRELHGSINNFSASLRAIRPKYQLQKRNTITYYQREENFNITKDISEIKSWLRSIYNAFCALDCQMGVIFFPNFQLYMRIYNGIHLGKLNWKRHYNTLEYKWIHVNRIVYSQIITACLSWSFDPHHCTS